MKAIVLVDGRGLHFAVTTCSATPHESAASLFM